MLWHGSYGGQDSIAAGDFCGRLTPWIPAFAGMTEGGGNDGGGAGPRSVCGANGWKALLGAGLRAIGCGAGVSRCQCPRLCRAYIASHTRMYASWRLRSFTVDLKFG